MPVAVAHVQQIQAVVHAADLVLAHASHVDTILILPNLQVAVLRLDQILDGNHLDYHTPISLHLDDFSVVHVAAMCNLMVKVRHWSDFACLFVDYITCHSQERAWS